MRQCVRIALCCDCEKSKSVYFYSTESDLYTFFALQLLVLSLLSITSLLFYTSYSSLTTFSLYSVCEIHSLWADFIEPLQHIVLGRNILDGVENLPDIAQVVNFQVLDIPSEIRLQKALVLVEEPFLVDSFRYFQCFRIFDILCNLDDFIFIFLKLTRDCLLYTSRCV